MPNQEAILRDCIEHLNILNKRARHEASDMVQRFEFIVEILKNYFTDKKFDLAESVLRDQVRLLTMKSDSHYGYVNASLYPENVRTQDISVIAVSPLGKQYLQIMIQAIKMLHIYGIEASVAPGISITHRVWVGGALLEDLIKKIISANIALEEIWTHSQDPRLDVRLQHYIWTDRKDLLSGLVKIPKVQFKNIDELFDVHDPLYNFYLSFLAHKEYSFVSDLARMQACYKYGGMFLGISWSKAPSLSMIKNLWQRMKLRHKMRKTVPFAPTVNLFAIFNYLKDPFKFFQPFSTSVEEQVKHYIAEGKKYYQRDVYTQDLTDSEIIYCGKLKHYVMKLIIDYQRRCLLAMGKNNVPDVMKNYRTAKYQELPKKFFELNNSQADAKAEFKKVTKKAIHDTADVNLALVTNTIPVRQALVDLGYFQPQPHAEDSFRLGPENSFDVIHEGYMLVCARLQIGRFGTQSWTSVNPASKISSEI
ncbi:hypothetical protein AAEX28_04495 [Lentisphaerota bacterium WC36G]|nr:hypothetical protein LJT99_07355 [Lentisphaerae bacterium WC36]